MNPISSNSINYIFNSANSLGVILYGQWDMGAVPGSSSMVNSTSWFGGNLGKSSENTSGNFWTTGMSSRLLVVVLWTDAVGTEGRDS
jgi:hypothetical protein